jgi:hypothetical protein
VGTVIGITLGAYMAGVYHQNRMVLRSQAWNYQMAISEAGVEEALTQLYYSPENLYSNGWQLINGAYHKQRRLPGGYYEVAISNLDPPVIYSQGYAQLPGTTNYLPSPRVVRVNTRRLAMFPKGLVAKGVIDLHGNNIKTDSFDSADPLYSDNGRYRSERSRDNGDIGTNSSLTNSLIIGNGNIFGKVSTGPGGSVSIGPGGAVGSKTWQQSGNNGIQPGAYSDDMNVDFHDVAAPFTSAPTPNHDRVDGTNYVYVLGTGNYLLPELSLSGQQKVLVNGDAVLFVTGDIKLAGQSLIYLAPDSNLTIYVAGASSDLGGNGAVNSPGNATNFVYYGLPSNTSIKLSGNAAFTGLIYAPDAAFTLGGGGSSDYDFVGAAVVGSATLNGHYNFHYDENASRFQRRRDYVIAAWNEI